MRIGRLKVLWMLLLLVSCAATAGENIPDDFILGSYRLIGKAMLRHLAQIAVSHDCGRLEWSVLDWNQPAIRFYQSIGARPQQEWVGYRVTGDVLKQLANG